MNTVNKKDVCQKFNQELEGIKRYVEKCKAVFNEIVNQLVQLSENIKNK